MSARRALRPGSSHPAAPAEFPPFTPAAVVEMGFLSHAQDRQILLEEQGTVARGIADGITRFLARKPQSVLFAQDILVTTVAPPK